jgi:prepilin-type N-terminal cleavage/methylation domain-containing protein
MMRRGFTVVELIITITIMGILLTLAVVSLTATQANSRDSERKGDAEAIALNLESYYNNGADNADGSTISNGGSYPGTNQISNSTTFALILPDIDTKSVHAPGVDVSAAKSLVVATNSTQTVAGVAPKPSKTNDVYVYQPITSSGTLCNNSPTTECRKFNLYYFQEVSGTVEMVTSKYQ